MIIFGSNTGHLRSLDISFQEKNFNFVTEDLFLSYKNKNNPINQINSNQNNQIFFGTANGMIGVLDKSLKKLIKTKNLNDTQLNVFHNFKNGSILAFHSNYLRLWKNYKNTYYCSNNKLIFGKKFEYIAVDQSESFFLSSSFYANEIYLWSIVGNKIILGGKNELNEFITSFKGMNEDIFAVGTHTGSIYIYTIHGKLIRSMKKNYLNFKSGRPVIQKSVAWLNKNVLFSGKSNGKIEIIDLRLNKDLYQIKGHPFEISNLVCSDEKLKCNPFFVASSDISGGFKVWDIRNNTEIFSKKNFNFKITSLGFQ